MNLKIALSIYNQSLHRKSHQQEPMGFPVLITASRVRFLPVVLCCISSPLISHTFLSISLYHKA